MDPNVSVRSFYRNKSILITGATGFVAKLILYKLLISCAIDKIYVLIRSKNNESFEKRVANFLEEQIFGFISDKKILSKIHAIEGDVCLKNLGLNACDLQLIVNKVSIVFHSAATIRFTAPLKEAIEINVCGTLNVIELCQNLQHLDALVHISTAFCNPHQTVCDELIYDNHVKPDDAIDLIRILSDEQIKSITKSYIGQFPNTYTFTKNLAENLIKEKCASMPSAIVRPSIVTPAFSEPDEGWIDSLNGITGGALMGALGLIRTSRIKLDMVTDLIPVDILANISIVSAYATASHFKNEIKVYNANSYNLNQLTNEQFQRYFYNMAVEYPFPIAVRPPAPPQTKFTLNPIIYYPTKFFSEICFAYLCDAILLLSGRKRVVVQYIRRLHKVLDLAEFFSLKNMNFKNENLLRLKQLLANNEDKIFNIDVQDIDWQLYCRDIYFGGRKYLLKEKVMNIKRDRLRMMGLRIGYAIFNCILILTLFIFVFFFYGLL